VLGADRLHKVRIAAKKLRYTLELGAKAARLTVGREIAMLKRVQELLGRLHDLQILQSHVQAVAAGSGSDVRLTRALGGILATFETDCRTLHAVFLARRQKLLDLAARVRQVAAVPRDATPNVGHEAPARMLRMRALVKRRVS
jgi:CHAD domain-containing protein